MHKLPKYSTLVANFPKGSGVPTHALLEAIGGEVRAQLSDAVNTCAVRMSVTLNKSGAPIRRCPGVYLLKGQAPPNPFNPRLKGVPSLYVIRAREMKTYLEHAYGSGRLIYDGRKQINPMFSPRPTQGIVVFEWIGAWAGFQAGGHVDLLKVIQDESGNLRQLLPNCEGHCYFLPDKGPMRAYLWETRP